jgi:UDP-N-acetylglucosamine 2-epimerase (non-hydrolysing)
MGGLQAAVMKVLSLFGTRPEVVKMAPVVHALERAEHFRTINISSSQHADLAHRFARQFGVRIDHDLEVMAPDQTPSEVCGRVVSRLDALLAKLTPDVILVQGDTTTSFGGALAGFHRRIPVAHVEAGLRTDDPESPFPEEMNRRLITRVARFHFAATAHNAATLASEGVLDSRVAVTGNPVVDALQDILRTTIASEGLANLLASLRGHRLIAVTSHRRENFGEVMAGHFRALRRFVERHDDVAVVFPVHPNPNVRRAVQGELADARRIHCIDPLDYPDFIHLLSAAWLIVSDSGGVQEEAPTLRKPLLVLRENTERPEAVECGVARLVGRSAERLESLLEQAIVDTKWFETVQNAVNPFGDGNSGERIATALEQFLAREAA